VSAPADVKACCANAYAGDAARWLLGEHFHPGGAKLTSRLAAALAVEPGRLVVDVASGRGASTLQVARETGCEAIGVELSPASVETARAAAQRAGLADRARFVEGDAESLPCDDAIADGVICECALCTFPDKRRAVAEIARILKPGGMLALSDMVAERERLPDDLRGLAAWVSCFADARPLGEVEGMLAEAGLAPVLVERHDDALTTLLGRVDARLRAARVLGASAPRALVENVERGLGLVASARRALTDGVLGYGVIVARRT
jgi:arsenite methyltransferase